MIVIVPNYVSDAINRAIDKEINKITHPEDLEAVNNDRESLYNGLLSYYNDHGTVPEFTLEKK